MANKKLLTVCSPETMTIIIHAWTELLQMSCSTEQDMRFKLVT